MSKIFLISDTHFGHNRSFCYEPRGYSSIEEMNEDLIKKWNEIITPDDIVYHLGDVAVGINDIQQVLDMLRQLNGRKYLAFGNHDTEDRIKIYKENKIFNDIQMGYRLRYRKKSCILTHYPTNVSNYDETSTINFHGHTHSKDTFLDKWYQYNVCVDAHSGYPVNIDDAIDEMLKIKNKVKND